MHRKSKSYKGLLIGSISLLTGAAAATAVVLPVNAEVKRIPIPGPTVTHQSSVPVPVPVPGPTVTKTVKVPGPKVTVRETVRSTSRSGTRKPIVKKTTSIPKGSVQNIAKSIFGDEYSCIASLISHESGWRVNATNPTSGAYGLPQALPASKMASAGSDWRTNPVTQLQWMKTYVNSRYGGACAAWNFWQSHNYY